MEKVKVIKCPKCGVHTEGTEWCSSCTRDYHKMAQKIRRELVRLKLLELGGVAQ